MASPLTISDILAWADAYRIACGRWPTRGDGPVKAGPLGTNWRQIQNALSLGLRGLPGGSSLAQLLAEHRGYRNVKALPPLTEDQIASWAANYHESQGQWPNEYSGAAALATGEVWSNIDAALKQGHRGLPGDDSLAKLISRRFGVRTLATVPPLTVSQILAWADKHREVKENWPTRQSGEIVDAPGETWAAIDMALQSGCRSLEGGSSLAKLLAAERGNRHKGQLPRLTKKQILAWAKAYHERTGQWPSAESGSLADAPDETWKAIDLALHQGLRGLPGGSSLHALLVYHGLKEGRRTKHVKTLQASGRGRPSAVGRRRQVRRMRSEGLTLQQIAKRLGITHQAVSSMLRDHRSTANGGDSPTIQSG